MLTPLVRWMVRRNIDALNAGDNGPTLAMFADRATLCFPGHNSWSNQFRPARTGRRPFATHVGRLEIEAFLDRYVDAGIQMVVEDVLVNGPPWRMRMAVRVHVWAPGPDVTDVYDNRAVLMIESRWGKILRQEDYEDTERAAAFDAYRGEPVRSGRHESTETGRFVST